MVETLEEMSLEVPRGDKSVIYNPFQSYLEAPRGGTSAEDV